MVCCVECSATEEETRTYRGFIEGVLSQLAGHYVELSKQKYSSNVVEKAILLNDDELTTKITEEIVASQEVEMLLHHSVRVRRRGER